MLRVALLGLGTMGAGMAGRLLKAGWPLTVWNRSRERAAALVEEGAILADSPQAASAAADVVISMVADDEASQRVWLGENGALSGARAGTILLEASTLSPAWVRELAAAAAEHGCDFLDAPVTGSKPQAAAGELLFLVGGEQQALELVLPVLRVMSRDVIHLGPTGSGALMKLINNFLCGAQVAAFAEALALIEKSGLEREQALAVLTNGAPGSPLVKVMAARMTAHDYSVNFVLELMQKDLTYALAEAERHSVPLSTAATARRLFERATEAGYGKQDFSAVVELLRDQLNSEC
jgi:3-hydroxyisobutyrate dehydrogenase